MAIIGGIPHFETYPYIAILEDGHQSFHKDFHDAMDDHEPQKRWAWVKFFKPQKTKRVDVLRQFRSSRNYALVSQGTTASKKEGRNT